MLFYISPHLIIIFSVNYCNPCTIECNYYSLFIYSY